MSDKNKKLKEGSKITRKIARWFLLTLFLIFFYLSLIFYNLFTVTSEKNIKTLAEKIVSDIVLQNRELIDKHYDEILLYAENFPESDLEFPSGLSDLSIKIKGNEIKGLSKDEFYKKIPVLIADDLYEELSDSMIKENVKKNAFTPIAVKKFVQANKNDKVFITFFYITTILCFLCLAGLFFISKISKILIRVGLLISLTTSPIFLAIYFMIPFVNNILRQTELATITSLAVSLLEQIQRNFLFSSILGLIILAIGVFLKLNIKINFKKKNEFEKIIRC